MVERLGGMRKGEERGLRKGERSGNLTLIFAVRDLQDLVIQV